MAARKPAPPVKWVDLSAVQARSGVIFPAPKEFVERYGNAKPADFRVSPYSNQLEADETVVEVAFVEFDKAVAAGVARHLRWETYKAVLRTAAEKEAAKQPPPEPEPEDPLAQRSRRERRMLLQVDSMTRRRQEREAYGSPLGYSEWVEAGEPKS